MTITSLTSVGNSFTAHIAQPVSEHIPIFVGPDIDEMAGANAESKPLTKKKIFKKVAPDIRKKIEGLASKIRSGEMTQQTVADKYGVDRSSVSRILQKLEKGDAPTPRKVPQALTPEIRKKVKKLELKIKNAEVTKKEVADDCGISYQSLNRILDDTAGSNTESKPAKKRNNFQKITPDIRGKIEELKPKITRGALSYTAVALQFKVSRKTVRRILEDLKAEKVPTPKKVPQKTTPEIVKIIQLYAARIEKKEVRQEDVAKECGISQPEVSRILRDLREGIDPTSKKVLKKITPEIRDRIKELEPQIRSGELKAHAVAMQLEISVSSMNNALQALEQGKDPAVGKVPTKITPEIRRKIRGLALKVKSGEMTQKAAAAECGVSAQSLARTLKAVRDQANLSSSATVPQVEMHPAIIAAGVVPLVHVPVEREMLDQGSLAADTSASTVPVNVVRDVVRDVARDVVFQTFSEEELLNLFVEEYR